MWITSLAVGGVTLKFHYSITAIAILKAQAILSSSNLLPEQFYLVIEPSCPYRNLLTLVLTIFSKNFQN